MKTLGHPLVALLAGAGLGAGTVTWWPSSSEPAATPSREPSPLARAPAPPAAPAPRCVATLDEAQLRQLEAELAQLARGAVEAPPAPGASSPPPAPPSPQSLAAAEAAAQRIDDAISSGRWTREDQAALRGVMSELTTSQTEAVMSKITLAINEGRVRPEHPGPLF
jgi:hypothetical protein